MTVHRRMAYVDSLQYVRAKVSAKYIISIAKETKS